jgi:hypothetical protein
MPEVFQQRRVLVQVFAEAGCSDTLEFLPISL